MYCNIEMWTEFGCAPTWMNENDRDRKDLRSNHELSEQDWERFDYCDRLSEDNNVHWLYIQFSIKPINLQCVYSGMI